MSSKSNQIGLKRTEKSAYAKLLAYFWQVQHSRARSCVHLFNIASSPEAKIIVILFIVIRLLLMSFIFLKAAENKPFKTFPCCETGSKRQPPIPRTIDSHDLIQPLYVCFLLVNFVITRNRVVLFPGFFITLGLQWIALVKSRASFVIRRELQAIQLEKSSLSTGCAFQIAFSKA